jgi:hypothetical protein
MRTPVSVRNDNDSERIARDPQLLADVHGLLCTQSRRKASR